MTLLVPERGPFRINTFVQRHTNSVHLVNRPIEVCFEISVCAECIADVAYSTVFCVQLNWFEVLDVVYHTITSETVPDT